MNQHSISYWKEEFAKHGFVYLPISGGADNFAVTAGSGTTIAADDISSVYYQRVKIAQGADGTGVDVSSAAPLCVLDTPSTSGGLSVANFNTGDTFTALTNSAQVIKGSAGQMYGYYIYNPNASATYVIVYNIAAASVTVGTSTPAMVFCIPATSGANLSIPQGIAFSTAMSIAATTTGGGNSAPSSSLECMVWYK